MLTTDKLDAMATEARTQLWQKLCVARYGNSSYRAKASRDLGVGRNTIFRWEHDHTVPPMAIMLMDLWVSLAQLGDLKPAFDRLDEIRTQLCEITS